MTAQQDAEPVLRAGVVGLGMMGRNHVRVYESLEGVDLCAVADPDGEAVAGVTADSPVRGYADARRMFAEEELDLVSIVAPTSLHAPLAIAALQAGANVLVEKPIAADRPEAEAMMAAAADAGRMLTVGHIERFNPAIRELRARLAAGEAGRVFQIHASRLGPFPARIRDVGVVVDLATHDIDVMRYLLGSDPVRVYAETERRIHTDHEDLFCGLVKFENGAVGVLDVNWLTPTKKREISVTGERGMFVADYVNQELRFYRNREAGASTSTSRAAGAGGRSAVSSVAEGEMSRLSVARAEPLAVELGEFARAVRTGRSAPVDARDAMIALLLARKMIESARSQQAITGEALAEVLA